MRKLLLLRPEPGLSASAERAQALGLQVVSCPLFRVEPVEWQAPGRAEFDGLLLTSANAVRHGGAELAKLTSVPVHAVGSATADAAREAGFPVATVGTGHVLDLLANLPRTLRLLHVAGEDHRYIGDRPVERRIAYRSVAIDPPGLPPLQNMVVAIHSPRAGQRLAELATERGETAIAAMSIKAADACGPGWEHVEASDEPNDNSLLALAARLCHTSSPQ